MKKIIKITCSDTAQAKPDGSNPMIFKFLPDQKNIWKDCEFFWNDFSVKKADYWIIIGDVDLAEEECEVSFENVIFMTGEPESIKRYDISKDFINQFGRVFSSQKNINHPKVYPCRPPLNWWIDAGHPIKSQEDFNSWNEDGLTYNDFKNLKEIKKDKLLSVFCSDKFFTEGHKLRFNFCKKLKNHFKDKIDWFGSGVNPVASKWEGIAPYKYHIVIENSQSPNYWTEKLVDPYMVLTYPIYFGANNIGDYFSSNQITEIDINYPKTAIAKIERLIAEKVYEKNFTALLGARDLVMDKYNCFNLISDIVENDKKSNFSNKKPQLIRIKQEEFFLSQIAVIEKKPRKNFLQRLKKSLTKKSKKIINYLVDNLLLIKFNKFE